jgi:hypothetical protein
MLFHGGMPIGSDQRFSLVNRMLTMSVKACKAFVVPVLIALHSLGGNEGISDASSVDAVGPESIVLPPALPPSAESLSPEGVYLLFDSVETFVWIGRAADRDRVETLFGPSYVHAVSPSSFALL